MNATPTMPPAVHERAVVSATYLIQSPLEPGRAAAILAGEQSVGSHKPVAGEEAAGPARAAVTSIEVLAEAEMPDYPSAYLERTGPHQRYMRSRIVVDFPADNAGDNLPTWWATLAGNLFELGELTAARLEHVAVPSGFADRFPGPHLGIDGTRRLAGVASGPLIGTIVKPSLGLSPEGYAERARVLAEGGIDFIKDDELMANPPHCPFERRVEAVMAVLRRHAHRTGKAVMYAFNITDDADGMRANHDKVVSEGGSAVMVTLPVAGLSGVLALRRHSVLPIHGHRAGWGMVSRAPGLGIDFQPFQLIHRLAGADHLHIGGFSGKFFEDDTRIGVAGRACLARLGESAAGQPAMPVISAGQWGGQAWAALEKLGSQDVLYLSGAGIQGHPDGIAAGVQAIRDAWTAAAEGVTFQGAVAQSKPLRRAAAHFS